MIARVGQITPKLQPLTPAQKGAQLMGKGVKVVAEQVGQGAKWAAKGTVQTAFDAAKYCAKRTFDQSLDFTFWIAKKAFLVTLGATVVTAVGAAISPTYTCYAIQGLVKLFGGTPTEVCGNCNAGDVLFLPTKYMGLLFKTAIEMGAKTIVDTADALFEHAAKPLAGKVWQGVKACFGY